MQQIFTNISKREESHLTVFCDNAKIVLLHEACMELDNGWMI